MTVKGCRSASCFKRARICSAALLCILAASCATRAIEPMARAPAVDPKLGVAPSPIVAGVRTGKPLRKGGGRYHVGKPYKIAGNWYYPKTDLHYDRVGTASWYGQAFHGRLTANGEIYDMNSLTAAHPTMPLPSYARVTNLDNDRSVIVRVNDRGPFARNRLIDLSKRTAQLLEFDRSGTAKVRVEYIDKARLDGQDGAYLLASYNGPNVPPVITTGGRPVMTADARPPRSRGDQVSTLIVASGTSFDPYLALTNGQGAAFASQRFGRMPIRQAGFDTATPRSSGRFVRGS